MRPNLISLFVNNTLFFFDSFPFFCFMSEPGRSCRVTCSHKTILFFSSPVILVVLSFGFPLRAADVPLSAR